MTTLGLLGCTGAGGDPEPDRTATEAAVTPDPTPTPSRPPRPERPAAMDDVTVDGAIAAATYFISLYPYVYNTGDLSEWNTLSDPECAFCSSVNENVEKLRQDGHHLSGGGVTVVRSSGTEIEVGKWFGAELLVEQAPGVNVDSNDDPVSEHIAGSRYKMTYTITHDGNRWMIREVEPQAADE
ncbi:DUF6318 family protein [Cellulomonas cellasea]|uniref:DUF6318 family protein n=1 Tax=Cellulomonas cellasea TaxID=43670 RepID=UPI0025A498D0|nr:DUF6318 family protein [Cellulomonas cellasea]MDM8086560.1 DUF6318 family protein [Cellulomonas cellasea]